MSGSGIVNLTVRDDMRLLLSPYEVGRDAEHNAATFKIVSQPASLDALACRAEIKTPKGLTYRAVTDGEFILTNDFAVAGVSDLQLVYGDGTTVSRKTTIAQFYITPSLNAVDESNPDFADGLAQLQQAAFCRVDVSTGIVRFYNLGGVQVGQIQLPGSVEDLDTLYLRRDGMNTMSGSIGFMGGTALGLSWENAQQGAIYSDVTLRLRRGIANNPITIEDQSGASASRSPIVTEASGDLRYLRELNANSLYLALTGGQMGGQIIMPNGGSVTNAALAFGDNATGFYRVGNTVVLTISGQIYAQWLGAPPSLMSVVPINMANQVINSLGDPIAATDAVNRRYVDSQISGIPSPPPPYSQRAYIPNEITITNQAQVFFDQAFPLSRGGPATILVICYLDYDGATPGSFYDLGYTAPLFAAGVEERCSVYLAGTSGATAYLKSPIVFAQTLANPGTSVQITLLVRQVVPGGNPLVQVGQRPTMRSYVTITEMQS